ncbi:MAG: MarR family winged helix-turn-helix transcriptional regulator [Oscillospiraceae bacterium]|nr:MarR family winged helix-turn-helix transcriptional regulator [Oscillospiraceae bacterium]
MNSNKKMLMELILLSHVLKRHMDSSTSKKYVDNLTGTNGWVIGYLWRNRDHDVFQRDIEEEFSIRRSTVSKILKLMEEKELIKRECVEYDARLKKLVLLPKSLEIQKMIDEDFDHMCDKAFANLTDEEKESLMGIILKIKQNFD